MEGKKVAVLREISGEGKLMVNFHKGQTAGWLSKARVVGMLAGSQGGKTSFGPHWLEREIREKGAGDYLIGTSTYPLLSRKLLPEFLYVFKDLFRLGEYNESKKEFTFWTEKTKRGKGDYVMFPGEIETKVFIGSAQNPESMESATVKGVWLDECGQHQFKRETWEAVERRTLINKARILMTTTLYGLGWLKTDIYDEWVRGNPEIEVIQFDSTENPAFPKEEYNRIKGKMPAWKFDLFHRGRYTKPAGLIYDAFNTSEDVIEPFEIPMQWPRYVGHDFGPAHTIALWKAYDTGTGIFYTYREYYLGGLSTFEHVTNWIELSKGERIANRYGGAPIEEGWRGDFTQAGWRIEKPLDGNVESGIMRVYGFEKLQKHKVFRTCQNYISEKTTYSRELDDMYNPTQKIENKEIFHFMDAERYMMTQFRPLSVVTGERDVALVGRRV